MVNTLPDVDLCHYIDIQDNQLLTQSTRIAEVFGRNHKNVLASIRKLDCSDYFTELNFQPSQFIDSSGRKNPMYNVTKDGFMFLVMGFTGKDAAIIKEAYINAFNFMAEKLATQQDFSPQVTELHAQNQKLQNELLDLYRDKVNFLEQKQFPQKTPPLRKPRKNKQVQQYQNLKFQAFVVQALAIIQAKPGINKTALLNAMGYAKDNKQARALLDQGEGKHWECRFQGNAYACYIAGVNHE